MSSYPYVHSHGRTGKLFAELYAAWEARQGDSAVARSSWVGVEERPRIRSTPKVSADHRPRQRSDAKI